MEREGKKLRNVEGKQGGRRGRSWKVMEGSRQKTSTWDWSLRAFWMQGISYLAFVSTRQCETLYNETRSRGSTREKVLLLCFDQLVGKDCTLFFPSFKYSQFIATFFHRWISSVRREEDFSWGWGHFSLYFFFFFVLFIPFFRDINAWHIDIPSPSCLDVLCDWINHSFHSTNLPCRLINIFFVKNSQIEIILEANHFVYTPYIILLHNAFLLFIQFSQYRFEGRRVFLGKRLCFVPWFTLSVPHLRLSTRSRIYPFSSLPSSSSSLSSPPKRKRISCPIYLSRAKSVSFI